MQVEGCIYTDSLITDPINHTVNLCPLIKLKVVLLSLREANMMMMSNGQRTFRVGHLRNEMKSLAAVYWVIELTDETRIGVTVSINHVHS